MKAVWTRWEFRRIDAAGVALCAVGALLFYWASLRPVLHQRGSFAAQENYLNEQRRKIGEFGERVAAIRARFDEVNAALSENPIQLEQTDRVNNRIARLTDMGVASGLKIDEVWSGKITYGPQRASVPIHLSGGGTYRAWTAFMHQLRERFPDTAVDSFELKGNPGAQAAPAQFQISLIWWAAPSRVATGK